MEQPQLNPEFIIQSLQIQLSEAHLRIAERDALITEYYQKIQELEKELAALKEKVKQWGELMGFLNDLVNLTQVQFFIKYWWLWLLYVLFIMGS